MLIRGLFHSGFMSSHSHTTWTWGQHFMGRWSSWNEHPAGRRLHSQMFLTREWPGDRWGARRVWCSLGGSQWFTCVGSSLHPPTFNSHRLVPVTLSQALSATRPGHIKSLVSVRSQAWQRVSEPTGPPQHHFTGEVSWKVCGFSHLSGKLSEHCPLINLRGLCVFWLALSFADPETCKQT